jgi:hypothetical protein
MASNSLLISRRFSMLWKLLIDLQQEISSKADPACGRHGPGHGSARPV